PAVPWPSWPAGFLAAWPAAASADWRAAVPRHAARVAAWPTLALGRFADDWAWTLDFFSERRMAWLFPWPDPVRRPSAPAPSRLALAAASPLWCRPARAPGPLCERRRA